MAGMHKHKPLWEISAENLIQEQRICCRHQEMTLEDCATMMEQNGVRRLPIVNEDKTIAGILSMGDIVAFATKRVSKAKKNKSVSYDSVIALLKQVSGHHESEQHALIAVK